MTDKELLELAAKAAGIDVRWVEGSLLDDYYKLPTTGYLTVSEGRNHVWNPLTSSGDALRLAVKLEIDVMFGFPAKAVQCVYPNQPIDYTVIKEDFGNDPYAATRRAIVRAAAEIG